MKPPIRHRPPRHRRGSTLVEFALVALVLFALIFSVVEMGRMILVYTTLADSARAGVRYAIVHGSTRTGAGVDGPSGPGDNPANVVTTVKNLASAGLLDITKLQVSVTYPDGTNDPGFRVSVRTVYPYDPFTVLPLGVNLGSITESVIVF
jgi:Flp pilus assembly protein TadG